MLSAALAVILQLGVQVEGTVMNAHTRLPVLAAEVWLEPMDDSAAALQSVQSRAAISSPLAQPARSDTKGRWKIAAVRPGVYTVVVRAIGFEPVRKLLTIPPQAGPPLEFALIPAAHDMDLVVITGSRRGELLGRALVSTQVVDREAIKRSGAADLAALLTEETGIHLQGGHPAGAGLMLQGMGAERVLVLIDGHPMGGRISGVLDISRFPTSMVERIEVVKGPQSTMYGSDAMGGVVNVITRKPLENVLDLGASIRVGSESRRDISAEANYGREGFALSGIGGFRRENIAPGVSSPTGAQALRSDLAAGLSWNATPSLGTRLSLIALDERQRWRTSGAYLFSDNTELTARAEARMVRGKQQLSLTAFSTSNNHTSRGSVLPKPIEGDDGDPQVSRIHQIELIYNGDFGQHLLIDAGTSVRTDVMSTSRINGGRRTLTTIEPFAQVEIFPSAPFSLAPGIRATHSTQWGSHLTPRVAARLSASDNLTIRGSVARGFRAPDFKELYLFFQNTSAGYAVNGNPSLLPETSLNVSGGATLVTQLLTVRGEIFLNDFRDFIETRTVSAPGDALVFEYANISNGRTSGIEFEADFAIGATSAQVALSTLSTRDNASGRELLGRPRIGGRLQIAHTLSPGTNLSVATIFTGRTPMLRDEDSGAVTGWRDSFLRTDARVGRGVTNTLELHLGVDNIFDARPESWGGFTGRRIYSGLSWSMRGGKGG